MSLQEAEQEALLLKKRANDSFSDGDFEAAVELYTNAIKLAPSALLFSNRAASYMMLGWFEQALRDIKSALRKDPGNVRALERRAKCQLVLDRLDDAAATLRDLEASVASEDPEELLLAGRRTDAELKRMRWLADTAVNPAGLQNINSLLAALPTKAELNSPLGIRLRKCQVRALVEQSDALDHQRKIRPATHQNSFTHEDEDEITEITPFAERAVEVATELLKEDPDDVDMRYWRGRALLRLGSHKAAEDDLRVGLQAEPEDARICEAMEAILTAEEAKVRGHAYLANARYLEAIQCFSAGIASDPDCVDTFAVADLHYHRSCARRQVGEFKAALEDVNIALGLHPKWVQALYLRGKLLLELDQPPAALTELKVVQRADPTFDDDLQDWLRRAHCMLAKPAGSKNYYLYMGIPMDATQEEIRRAYRKLCLAWHPDKSRQDGHLTAAEVRARFEELQEAYQLLSNESRRAEYDFGTWRDTKVRHHAKLRQKARDVYNELNELGAAPLPEAQWGERIFDEQLLDHKVESIHWQDGKVPEWVQEWREATTSKLKPAPRTA